MSMVSKMEVLQVTEDWLREVVEAEVEGESKRMDHLRIDNTIFGLT